MKILALLREKEVTGSLAAAHRRSNWTPAEHPGLQVCSPCCRKVMNIYFFATQVILSTWRFVLIFSCLCIWCEAVTSIL